MSRKFRGILPKSSESRNVFCIIFITVIMLILVIRSFFSFCQSDESLYIAFAHRFYMGDKPIIDEWHPVQFYVFVIYPFYWIYKLIVPTGAGVFLYFRILQKIMTYAISLFSYKQLRKISGNEYIALICTLAYQLYLQANIEGMSYYNMYISMVVLTVFMMFATRYETRKNVELFYYFASGIFMSIAVLCCPYLTIGIAMAIVIAFINFKNERKHLFLFLAGILSTAALFLLLFMPKNVNEIIKSLFFILNDPEHTENAFKSLINAVREGFTGYHLLQLGIMIVTGFVLLFVKFVRKKNISDKYLRLYILLSLVMIIPPQIVYVFSRVNGFNYFSLAIAAFSVMVIALIKKINIRNEVIIYVIGILASIFSGMASNTRSSALTSGLVLSAIAVILGTYKVFKGLFINEEMNHNLKNEDGTFSRQALFVLISRYLYIVTFLLVFGCIFANRIGLVYRDDDLNKLDTRITRGPAKGLYTSYEHNDMYNKVCDVFDVINEDYGENIKNKNIFISKLLPWGYLCFDCKVGAYSLWRIDIGSDRLTDYYIERPEKIPDIVVILSENVGAYKGEDKHNKNNFDGAMWEYINGNYVEGHVYDVANVWYRDEIKNNKDFSNSNKDLFGK